MSWYRSFEIDILRVGELHIQQNIDSIYPLAGTVLYTDGSGNTFWSTGGAGGGTITQENLNSTVDGLGNFYASTTAAGINAGDLFSTVRGLGTIGYISTAQLLSTVAGIGSGGTGGGITTGNLQSTAVGLGTLGYISSSQLTSTVRGLSANAGGAGVSSLFGVVSSGFSSIALFTSNTSNYYAPLLSNNYSTNLQSTVIGLGNVGYISTSQLISTVEGLGNFYTSTSLTAENLFSTVAGLGSIGYISSPQLISTVIGIGSGGTGGITTGNLQSTAVGLGTLGYISSSQLISTVIGLGSGGTGDVTTGNLQSTAVGLGTLGYISSSQLISTVIGLGSGGTGDVTSENLKSTVMGLGSVGYISSSQLISTVVGLSGSTGGAGVSSLFGVVSSGLSTVAGFTSNTSNYYLPLLSNNYSTNLSTVAQFTSNTSNYFLPLLSNNYSTNLSTVAQFTSNTSNYFLPVLSNNYSTNLSTVAEFTSNTSNYYLPLLSNNYSTNLSTVANFTSNTSNYFLPLLSNNYSTNFSTVAQFTSNTSNYFLPLLSNNYSTNLSTVADFTSNTSNYFLPLLSNNYSTNLESTTAGLGSAGYVSTSQLTSTIIGLGTLNYISSSQLLSTTYGLELYISSLVGTPPGNTTGTVLYLNYDTTVSPYKALQTGSTDAATTNLPTTLTGHTTDIPVSQFQSDFTVPPFIPQGIWDVNIFASTTDVDHVFIYISLYTRVGTTETLISTSDLVQITDLNKAQYNISFNVPYTILSVGTTLVVKVFANNIHGNSETLRTFYQGIDYSHIHTTFGSLIPADLLTSTVSGLGNAGYISASQLRDALTSTTTGLSIALGGAGVSSLFGVVSSGLSTVAQFTSNTSNYYLPLLSNNYSTNLSTVAAFTSNTSNYFAPLVSNNYSTNLSTVAGFTSNTSNYYLPVLSNNYSTNLSTVAGFTSNTSNYYLPVLSNNYSTNLSTVAQFTSNTSNYFVPLISNNYSTNLSTVAQFTSNTSNYFLPVLSNNYSTNLSTVAGFTSNTSNYYLPLLSNNYSTNLSTVAQFTSNTSNYFLPLLSNNYSTNLSTVAEFTSNTSNYFLPVLSNNYSTNLSTVADFTSNTSNYYLPLLSNNYSTNLSTVAQFTSNTSNYYLPLLSNNYSTNLSSIADFTSNTSNYFLPVLSNNYSTNLQSTVAGLGAAGYISTSQLTSTVSGLLTGGTGGGLTPEQLTSSIIGLATIGYISTSQLTSTVSGLMAGGTGGGLTTENLTSSIDGLASIGYISTSQLTSTVIGIGTGTGVGDVLREQLFSTTDGLGNIYVSSFVSYAFALSTQMISTAIGLGSLGYLSTSSLVSTVNGLGSVGYLSSQQLQSSIAGLGQIFVSTQDVVLVRNLAIGLSTPFLTTTDIYAYTQTANTLYSANLFVSTGAQLNDASLSIVYTTTPPEYPISLTGPYGQPLNFQMKAGSAALTLTTDGASLATIKSESPNVSINPLELQGYTIGAITSSLQISPTTYLTPNNTQILGSTISTALLFANQALVSSFIGDGSQLFNLTAVSSATMNSTVIGYANSLNVVSTATLESTVQGLPIYLGYLSTAALGPLTSTAVELASTITGLGQRFISANDVVLSRYISTGLSTPYITTSNIFTINETANTIYTGNLYVSTFLQLQDAPIDVTYTTTPTLPISFSGPAAQPITMQLKAGSAALTFRSDGNSIASIISEEPNVSKNPLEIQAYTIGAITSSLQISPTTYLTPNNTQIIGSTISTSIIIADQTLFSSIIADGSRLYNLTAVSTATMNSTIIGYTNSMNVVSTSMLASTVQGLPIYLGYLSTATLGPIISTALFTGSSASIRTGVTAGYYQISTTTSNLWVAAGAAATPAASLEWSGDGFSWTNALTGGFSVSANGVAWNGLLWVAVGQDATNQIQYSLNGSNWLATSGATFSAKGQGVAWNGNLWVAVGQDATPANTIKYSRDGITWSNSLSGFGTAGNAVAWNGRLWIAVGTDSSAANAIRYSYDGSNWSPTNATANSATQNTVAWNGYIWLAGGTTSSPGNSISYSRDGINWSLSSSPVQSATTGLAWNGVLWVASAVDNSANYPIYSADGLNWTYGSGDSFAQGSYGVAWGGSYWIAVGQDTNDIKYSSNADTWINSSANNFTTVAYGIAFSSNVVPSYSQPNFRILAQPIPSYLDSTNQIFIRPNSLTLNNTVLIDNLVNRTGINCNAPRYDLDVYGNTNTSLVSYASSFVGDGSGLINLAAISTLSLISSLEGLGSIGYISTSQLVSTVEGLLTGSPGGAGITESQLMSTVDGLGSEGYISTSQLTSTTLGLYARNLNPTNYVVQGLLTADQTIPVNTDTVIPFSADFDPQNWLKNGGSSTARFQPNVEGYYSITVAGWWSIGATVNQTNIQARKNGNTFLLLQTPIEAGPSGISAAGSKLIYMNGSTDYAEFTVFTGNTGGQILQKGSSGAGTWFSAALQTVGVVSTGMTSTYFFSTVITSTLQAVILSASTMTTSSLQVSSLTSADSVFEQVLVSSLRFYDGDGITNIADLQASNVSTIGFYASSVQTNTLLTSNIQVGTNYYQTAVQFYGLRGNFNNTVISEVSTGTGSQEFLLFKGSSMTDQIRVQTTGSFKVETGVSARLFPNTASNTAANFVIDNAGNITMNNYLQNNVGFYMDGTTSRIGLGCNTPGTTLDINGTIRTTSSITTIGIVSSFQAITGGFSTILVSSTTLLPASTVISQLINTNTLNASTINATSSIFSTLIVSSMLTTNSFFTTTGTASAFTISSLSANTISTVILNANALYVSSSITSTSLTNDLTANLILVSSLRFYDGDGITNIADIQASNVSTIGFYASSILTNAIATSNIQVGTNYFQNSIQFYGLRGNYNNSLIAEQSTGTTTQEFLIFKGSSIADQVRIQTTGALRFETGVSARLVPNTQQQTTPNLLIDNAGNLTYYNSNTTLTSLYIDGTTSRIGIGCNVPGTTLDINGTMRTTSSIATIGIVSSFQAVTGGFSTILISSTTLLPASTVVSQLINTNTLNASTINTTSSIFSTLIVSSMLTTNSFFTTTGTATAFTVSSLSANTISTVILNANAAFFSSVNISTSVTNDLTANFIFVSSLRFYDGDGITNIADIQSSNVSTIALYASSLLTNTATTSNLRMGTNYYQTAIQFYGLRGNFNNSVIAEQSTGITTQEFLFFKGSSTTDQIRVQTTGSFKVETGVSARLFPNTASNTAANFVIDNAGNITMNNYLQNNVGFYMDGTTSRIGLGCNTPGTTMDINGTLRTTSSIATIGIVSSFQAVTGGFSTILVSSTTLLPASTVISQLINTNTLNASTINATSSIFSTLIISSMLTTNSFFTTTGTASAFTISSLSANTISTVVLNANAAVFSSVNISTSVTNDLTANLMFVSSLRFYDGDGFISLPDLQTSNVSTIAFYTSSVLANGIVTNTIAVNTSNPIFTLDVLGNARISSLTVDAGAGVTSTNTAFSLAVWGAGGAARVGGTTWTQISDERVKENIVEADYTQCYEDIKALQLRRFTYTSSFFETTPLNDRNVLGFIAQEVKMVQPKSVVVSEAFGISDLNWLNLDQMNMSLYGAVKKLIQDNENLTSSVSGLQRQISGGNF